MCVIIVAYGPELWGKVNWWIRETGPWGRTPTFSLALRASLRHWVSPHSAGSQGPSAGETWAMAFPFQSQFLSCLPCPVPRGAGFQLPPQGWEVSGLEPALVALGETETGPCWERNASRGSPGIAPCQGPQLLASPTSTPVCALRVPMGEDYACGPRAWREQKALCLWPDISPTPMELLSHQVQPRGLGARAGAEHSALCLLLAQSCPALVGGEFSSLGSDMNSVPFGFLTCSSPGPSSRCPSPAQT